MKRILIIINGKLLKYGEFVTDMFEQNNIVNINDYEEILPMICNHINCDIKDLVIEDNKNLCKIKNFQINLNKKFKNEKDFDEINFHIEIFQLISEFNLYNHQQYLINNPKSFFNVKKPSKSIAHLFNPIMP